MYWSLPEVKVCPSVRSPAPKSGAGGWVGSGLVLFSDLAGADASPCTFVTSDFFLWGELFNTHYHRLHAADERTRKDSGTSIDTRPHRRTRGTVLS